MPLYSLNGVIEDYGIAIIQYNFVISYMKCSHVIIELNLAIRMI